jgi:hypothetical protein
MADTPLEFFPRIFRGIHVDMTGGRLEISQTRKRRSRFHSPPNAFGTAVWKNGLIASPPTVLVNNDAGRQYDATQMRNILMQIIAAIAILSSFASCRRAPHPEYCRADHFIRPAVGIQVVRS